MKIGEFLRELEDAFDEMIYSAETTYRDRVSWDLDIGELREYKDTIRLLKDVLLDKAVK